MSPLFVYNPHMPRALLPRLGDFLFVCVFAGGMLVGQRMLNVDGDLGRHLTLGNYMLDSGSVPVRDVLSFTLAGHSRPPYEWLAQVVFALASRLLGLDGVVLIAAAVIALAWLVAYQDGRRRSGASVLTLLIAVWAAAASSLHWLARPHVFSFLFFAVWLALLEDLRLGDRRAAWRLPLVMLAWANFHGGFVLGFVVWLAYSAGWIMEHGKNPVQFQIGKQLLLVGVTSLAASLLTPDLWNNWTAVLSNNSAYVLSRTAETMPARLASPGVWPFAGLLALALILGFLNWKRLAPAHGLLLLGLALVSLAIARNIPYFCLAAVPILATWAWQSLESRVTISSFENGITRIESNLRASWWPALVVAAVGASLALHGRLADGGLYGFDRSVFPVQAADWIETHPMDSGMFNDLNWGGYLLYRLWPEQRVFIDSQSDFYGEQFIRKYEEILAGARGWEEELQSRHVMWAILPPNSGLAREMGTDGDWRLAYEDPLAVIFMRQDAP